jgi:glycosyltransferase involved in cell wall biosynthesis
MKKISVVMAVYNGEKYLNAQIESILSQLSQLDELIVSVDLSSDYSAQ